MEGVTLGIAVLGALLVLLCRPVRALCVYIAVTLLYPDYLRISIGSLDISATRIIVCVLLLRCLVDARLMGRFRWRHLDKLVIMSMIVYAGALLCTTPFGVWLENRGGFLMDTLFIYFAVRLVVVDRPTFMIVCKAFAIITLPLAIHAVLETFTGWSLYSGLGRYCPWAAAKGMAYQTRYGLNRAMGPSGETIMFGLTFAVAVPLIWLLRYEPSLWKQMCYPLMGAAIVGVAATISSGPYLALLVILACLALQSASGLAKPVLAIVVCGCVVLEVLSNRHFYDVLGDRIGMDGASAYYRSQLLRVAFRELPEYWQYGYGLRDPGWGPLIDGRPKTDGVNHYVVCAVLYGLPGLAACLSVLAGAMALAIRNYRHARSPLQRSCAWSLGSAMIGLMVVFFSVCLFSHMVSVFYVLLGMHGALQTCFERSEPINGNRYRVRLSARQVTRETARRMSIGT